MKSLVKLVAALAAAIAFSSCGETYTEHHTVGIVEYTRPTPSKPAPKATSDDPRDFKPKEKF